MSKHVPDDLAACTWMQDAHEAVVSEMRAAYEERIAALSSDSDAKLQGELSLVLGERGGRRNRCIVGCPRLAL